MSSAAHKKKTWSDNDEGDKPSKSLDNKHDRTTSGVVCIHGPWTGHKIGQRLVWHAFLYLRLHTQTDDVGCGMP